MQTLQKVCAYHREHKYRCGLPIRQHITCQTANVIYVITCAKCKQYVGETSNCIRTWANQHRSDITTGIKNIPTVRHFKACGLGLGLGLGLVVERVRRHDVETRRERESFWIERIRPAINGQNYFNALFTRARLSVKIFFLFTAKFKCALQPIGFILCDFS